MKRVEIGGVNFHKKSFCDEKFPKQVEREQISEYDT